MFDGADLSAAYGTSLSSDAHGMDTGGNSFLMAAGSNGMNGMNGGHNVQLPPPPQSTATEDIVLPPPAAGAASHATPPEVAYYPPNAMYARGGGGNGNGAGAGGYRGVGGDSMWDKLSSKKYDVLKLVVLSLVILLAMSSDRVVNFYLMKYINGGIFTTVQEFLVRLSYPLVVLVILWLIKASA